MHFPLFFGCFVHTFFMKNQKKNQFYQELTELQPRKKKALGQHFLRKQSTVDHMIESVVVTSETTILEIGCGDGFLTRSILTQTPCKQLICYEIDEEWASYVRQRIQDQRLNLLLQNILTVDFDSFKQCQPLVVLANLPYQITFPIFFLFQKYRDLLQEGVVMIQEEVAQKIVATRGKSYNPTSIFLQRFFDFKLLEKIEPGAFEPAPKVYSRLLYFKPKAIIASIVDDEGFWKFLKHCFKSPRQTIKNNLRTAHYDLEKLGEDVVQLRAQQIDIDQFLIIWDKLTK